MLNSLILTDIADQWLPQGKQNLPETPHEPFQDLAGRSLHKPRTKEIEKCIDIAIEVRVELWRLKRAIERSRSIGKQHLLKVHR